MSSFWVRHVIIFTKISHKITSQIMTKKFLETNFFFETLDFDNRRLNTKRVLLKKLVTTGEGLSGSLSSSGTSLGNAILASCSWEWFPTVVTIFCERSWCCSSSSGNRSSKGLLTTDARSCLTPFSARRLTGCWYGTRRLRRPKIISSLLNSDYILQTKKYIKNENI